MKCIKWNVIIKWYALNGMHKWNAISVVTTIILKRKITINWIVTWVFGYAKSN